MYIRAVLSHADNAMPSILLKLFDLHCLSSMTSMYNATIVLWIQKHALEIIATPNQFTT